MDGNALTLAPAPTNASVSKLTSRDRAYKANADSALGARILKLEAAAAGTVKTT